MEEINYLIIGGGVAGTTAAETIRKNDSNGSIAIVSDEPHRFYSRILLSKPNFFLDKIPFDQIWLKTEAWYKDQNIQLLSGKKAIKLDSVGKIVTLDDGTAVIDAVKTAKRAVAIGGGFVSFEMCEMLRLAGLSVSLVIREPHYWDPILDGPSGRMVESALEKGGVKI